MADRSLLDGEQAERYAVLRTSGGLHGRSRFYHAVNRESLRPICGAIVGSLWAPEPGEAVTCPRCVVTLLKTRPKRTPTQQTWDKMKQRCLNPEHRSYPRYGGRGVRICARWLDSFENFLVDMGERPDGRTLDRINPDGDYEPSNCRWATPREQRHNRSKAPWAQTAPSSEDTDTQHGDLGSASARQP